MLLNDEARQLRLHAGLAVRPLRQIEHVSAIASHHPRDSDTEDPASPPQSLVSRMMHVAQPVRSSARCARLNDTSRPHSGHII